MEHFITSNLSFLVLVALCISVPSASGFSITETNSYLANHVIKTVFSKDWLSCTLACQGDNMCISYNYNTVHGVCDLNEHGIQEPFTGPDDLVKMQGVIFHQIRPAKKVLLPRTVQPGNQCDCSCSSESACSPTQGSYGSLPVSCKEIWEKSRIRVDDSFHIRTDLPSQYANVFCRMTPIPGCGDGGWTLAMKIDGTKQTFTYHSPYWNNTIAYNEGGGTSLAEVETKLSSYWTTPFTRLCLGMRYQNKENWISLNYTAPSLWDVISKGTHTATNVTLMDWKSLLTGSQIQEGCVIQGFNSDMPGSPDSAKARIGIIGYPNKCGGAAQSRIGFGTAGDWYGQDDSNSCGNEDLNASQKKAFGYIFVQ